MAASVVPADSIIKPLFEGMAPAFWVFAKFLFYAFLFLMALGMIVGLFTYGKRKEKFKSKAKTGGEEFIETGLFLGIALMHFLIELSLGKKRGVHARQNEWLDDRHLIAMLRGYTPAEFEMFVADVFTALGYKTELVGGKSDGGIDIDMTKDGRRSVVQCKKFITQKVNPHDVRDFYGAMGGQHIDGKGFFVTTNIFTIEAEQFAEGKPLELIDGTRLIELIHESGVLADTAKPTETVSDTAAQKKCPKCGSMLTVKQNRTNGSKFWACPKWPSCRHTEPMQ
jgi:restriction system protein